MSAYAPGAAPGWRPVAGLAAALVLAPVLAAADEGSSSRVAVTTSRGVIQMRLFGPGDPAAAGGSGQPAARPRPLVLFVSGEGGWRGFDDRVALMLARAGCWVGGVDAIDYFWDAQDDRAALGADVRRFVGALARAAGAPPASPLILAGFSFGADLAPWAAGSGGWERRVDGLLLLAPDETGSLQFRVLEILGLQPREHVFSVAGALRDVAGIPVAFLHGEKDAGSDAVALAAGAAEPKRLLVVPGADHHFTGREEDLSAAIARAIEWLEGADVRR